MRSLSAVLLTLALATACAPPPAAAQDAIRLATWNMEWLTDRTSPAGEPRSAADYARFAHYAQTLDADVVALQEVDGPEAAAHVFDPAEYAFFFEPGDNLQRTGFAVRRTLTVTDDPDYVELRTGNDRLRAGTVITVTVGGQPIRLMSVHLKSGCFDRPLATDQDACNGLRPQIPVLEAWIDRQAAGTVPFAVLGDWNRRLNTPGDEVWAAIDDGDPADADLTKVTEGRTSACENGRYPDYIDHLVLDRRATGWLVPESFRQQVYDAGETAKLSDHCPISVELRPGAGDRASLQRADAAPAPSAAVPLSIRWFRASAERRALALQTYRLAGEHLRQAVRRLRRGSWAVILDADETVLDNSVYQRRRAEAGLGYTSDTWNEWVREEAAPAIPGAVAFTRLVNELGGRVVIVSNRAQAVCAETERNLDEVGVDAAVVLCMQETSDKNARFQAVQNGAVPGLSVRRVVMWVGDNIQDFPSLTQGVRLQSDAAYTPFGDTYWMLPNPMYGSWERNPDAPDAGFTP